MREKHQPLLLAPLFLPHPGAVLHRQYSHNFNQQQPHPLHLTFLGHLQQDHHHEGGSLQRENNQGKTWPSPNGVCATSMILDTNIALSTNQIEMLVFFYDTAANGLCASGTL
jgi:hypothetical protein